MRTVEQRLTTAAPPGSLEKLAVLAERGIDQEVGEVDHQMAIRDRIPESQKAAVVVARGDERVRVAQRGQQLLRLVRRRPKIGPVKRDHLGLLQLVVHSDLHVVLFPPKQYFVTGV